MHGQIVTGEAMNQCFVSKRSLDAAVEDTEPKRETGILFAAAPGFNPGETERLCLRSDPDTPHNGRRNRRGKIPLRGNGPC